MTRMTAAAAFATIQPTLTIEQAREWEGKTDKWVYCVDHVIDPADINCSQRDALVDMIEDHFEASL